MFRSVAMQAALTQSAAAAGEQVQPRLAATVRVLSMAFFRAVVLRHDTGLGEAYMDGHYEVIPS